MSTGSSRLRALVVLSVAALACGGENGAGGVERPGGIQTRAVATALPAGATVVVSGYDLQGFWTRLQGSRLYQELKAVQGVRDALAPLEESRRELREEICLTVDEATIMSLFGRKFDLGFYGDLPGDRADLVVVADVADEDAARTLLEECEAQLATDKNATFADAELGGRSVRVASNREGEEVLFYALEDGRLTLGTTRERLGHALSLGDEGGEASPMTSVEGYTAALRKMPAANLIVYVDQAAIREAAEAVATDPAGAAAPEAERLAAARAALGAYPSADAFVFGFLWADSGIRGTSYARIPPGERPELARMLTATPGEVRSLSYQPEGTLFYAALNTVDARVVYDELYRYAVDATRVQLGVAGTADSARADSVVAASLARAEGELGIDVDEDVVPWVGREAAIAITGVDQRGFFPVPEVAVTVATTDPARTRRVMGTLEGQISEMALARASIPLQWQSVEHEGQTVRYAPTPMGEGLSLAWTATDQFLLVGSSRGLISRMLDARAGRVPALPSNPDFAAMTEFYPQQANSIGFVNVERILTEVEQLMTTYGQMSGNAAVADSASTARRVVRALKNAPRLGFYGEADGDGVFGHFMLEVR